METWKSRLADRIGSVSQTDLARRLGVSTATISRYKNGQRTPDPGMLKRICLELGISADWLLGLDSDSLDHPRDDSRERLREIAAELATATQDLLEELRDERNEADEALELAAKLDEDDLAEAVKRLRGE